MSREYGVTDKGFKRKDFNDIFEDIKDRLKSRIGDDIYLEKESPLRHILNSVSFEIARQWDVAEHIYASGYIDQASGKNLENLVSLAGVTRRPATKSTGFVRFEGKEAGIQIDEGTGLKTGDDIFFNTVESVILDEDGTATAEVESVERGEDVNVGAGTITEFVNTIDDVYSVTNPEPTTGGEEKETDKQLRLRTKRILEQRGNATKNAIKQRLLDKEGVSSVTLKEHTDEVMLDVTVGGIGEEFTEEDEKDLHDIMDAVRAYGIKYNLYTPQSEYIQVGGYEENESVKILVQGDYPFDAELQIETAIHEYINSLEVGDNVLYAKLYDVIYNVGEWVYNIENLKLAKLGETIEREDISIDGDGSEKPIIKNSEVTERDNERIQKDAGEEETWDSGDVVYIDEYLDPDRVIGIESVKDGDGNDIPFDYDDEYDTIVIYEDTEERYIYVTYRLKDIHIEIEMV